MTKQEIAQSPQEEVVLDSTSASLSTGSTATTQPESQGHTAVDSTALNELVPKAARLMSEVTLDRIRQLTADCMPQMLLIFQGKVSPCSHQYIVLFASY
jgi:hypothetical protein